MDEDNVPMSIIEGLCEILNKDPELKIFTDEMRCCQTVEEFKQGIDDIYDYCDENKIWVC